MALTNEQQAIVKKLLSAVDSGDRETLAPASIEDLREGITQELVSSKQQTVNQALAALVTGAVANWNALAVAAVNVEVSALYPALAAYTEAKQAKDAPTMLAHAVAAAEAAKKNYGV